MISRYLLAGALVALGIGTPAIAGAHGFAGKRFFPATLATEDPFVADELSLPTVSWQKSPASGDEPASRATDFAIEMAKRITADFGIGLGATYRTIRPDDGDARNGFDNVEARFKYKFHQDDAHEAIVSAGIDFDIGGTGSRRVGAESFTTITPAVFFGKGLGDLSDDLLWLRPLAITGQVGVGIPTRSSTAIGSGEDAEVERHPHTLEWGFSLQYSVPYLQSFVRDVGLRAPFDRMIPLVEVALSTALDRSASGTTGTVNPGIIWAGQRIQWALEAVIPINRASGNSVGVLAQLHFFLDDLFPQTLGRPLIR